MEFIRTAASVLLSHSNSSSPPFGLKATEQLGWSSWTWPPLVVLPLILFGLLYFVGVFRMFQRNVHSGVRSWQLLFFALGWLSLVIALDSPIHEIGEQLFWVHMTQHEILMVISAPLIVMARPLPQILWALPPSLRVRIGCAFRQKHVAWAWAAISAPAAAWVLHAVALWLWHIPVLFDATLRSDAMHAAQHISFFATALLFW
jgi:putative membrane protein